MAELQGTETEKNLLKAFAGESQARNRYTYAAGVARKAGYLQIARLFEETADNERALGILRELDIGCYASIILGPDWDRDDFARLRRKVREMGILFANYQPLTPLPGTAMGVEEEDLVVSREEYSHWDLAHLVVRPKRLSAREYYAEIIRLYTASVVHPLAIIRHLRYPLKDVLRISTGAFRVWRQYRRKMKEATTHG